MTSATEIEQAIATGDPDALDEVVARLCASATDHSHAELETICGLLSDHRRFTALGRVADAAIQVGHNGRMWRHLVQSLLDGGAYTAAQATIATALTRPGFDPAERPALAGQAGRIGKDLYLRTGEPEHLTAAIDAYVEGIHQGGDLLWLGVNAYALAHLARRRGIEVGPFDIESPPALLRRAEAGTTAGDRWAAATLVEMSLVVGNPVPVDTIATRLAGASPFDLASLRRQLRDVWELPADHPAILTLAELTLSHGGTDEIELPANPDGFEKMFGTEAPIPLENYKAGARAAESVCTIHANQHFFAGTGFALAGEHLHPSLAGRRVIVTNEHVVPMPGGGGPAPADLTATFTARNLPPVAGFTAVWWSARTDLDIAILVSDQLDQTDLASLEPATSLPDVVDGAYVYVVGHPGGGGIELSIRGNDLLDTNGVRLHYRAPTKGGSSGSPVFDKAWRLIGVHHYGSANLMALRHRSGRYAGNQGTALGAISERLATAGLDPASGVR